MVGVEAKDDCLKGQLTRFYSQLGVSCHGFSTLEVEPQLGLTFSASCKQSKRSRHLSIFIVNIVYIISIQFNIYSIYFIFPWGGEKKNNKKTVILFCTSPSSLQSVTRARSCRITTQLLSVSSSSSAVESR